MTFEEYQQFITNILSAENPATPYDDALYFDYTKLNNSRSNRWLKTGVLSAELSSTIRAINKPQNWILITEPWCGDAAHSVPFIVLLSKLNPLITLDIQLRDTDSEIDNYLTNGGKSIPILVVRNSTNQDLFHWGPRPVACQLIFDNLKAQQVEFEQQKIALQEWYNADKGVKIQAELNELFLKKQ